MLFVVFQSGKDRYALEARRVVEVVPFLELKRIPQAPPGVRGMFIYRGRPVPAIDLSDLTQGQPAAERLSTRIIIMDCPDRRGQSRLLGLVAEKATGTIRKDPGEFVASSLNLSGAAYLGPVVMDDQGAIQWLHEDRLISEPVQRLLFSKAAAQEA